MNFRITMAREADKSGLPCLLGCFKSLNGAARPEDLVDLSERTDLMNLPQIEMIGLHRAERLFQIRLGSLARALRGFCRHKDMLPEGRQDRTVDFFRTPVPVI